MDCAAYAHIIYFSLSANQPQGVKTTAMVQIVCFDRLWESGGSCPATLKTSC